MGGTNRAPVPGWGGNLPPYSGIVTKNALAVLPGEGTLPTDAPQSWGPGSPRSRRSAPSPQNTCMLVGCGRSAVGRRPSWQFEGLRGEGGHGRSSLVRRQQSCEVTATPLHLSFHGVRTASQSPATFSEKQQGKSRIGSIGLAEGGGHRVCPKVRPWRSKRIPRETHGFQDFKWTGTNRSANAVLRFWSVRVHRYGSDMTPDIIHEIQTQCLCGHKWAWNRGANIYQGN